MRDIVISPNFLAFFRQAMTMHGKTLCWNRVLLLLCLANVNGVSYRVLAPSRLEAAYTKQSSGQLFSAVYSSPVHNNPMLCWWF